MKKIYKSNNKMILGVCSGLAEFFNIDPTIVRLATVILSCITGFFPGLIIYIIASVIIPVSTESDYENLKSANVTNENPEKKNKEKESPRSDQEFDSYFKKES